MSEGELLNEKATTNLQKEGHLMWMSSFQKRDRGNEFMDEFVTELKQKVGFNLR